MNSRNLIAAILTAFLLSAGFLAIPLAGNSASAGQSVERSREGARSYVLESRRRSHRRSRTQRIYLPVGPAYIYYDYPYYYSRGHYPTHIGGYVYYIPRYRGRCPNGSRGCVARHRDPAISRHQR